MSEWRCLGHPDRNDWPPARQIRPRRARLEFADNPRLLRLDIWIAAWCARRRNDLEMPTARRRDLHVAVNPGRRADDAFRLGEFVAQGCRTATAHRWRLALDVRRARRPLLRRRVLSWLRRRHTCRCDGNERGDDQNDWTQRQFLAELRSVDVNVPRRKGFPKPCSGGRASGR